MVSWVICKTVSKSAISAKSFSFFIKSTICDKAELYALSLHEYLASPKIIILLSLSE